MVDAWPQHLFMVGCGNMAGQMLSRWLACGLDPASVTVLRPSGKPVAPGVEVITHFPARFPDGTALILGMKPHQFENVAAELAKVAGTPTMFISILAGTTAAQLRAALPEGANIVRVMPNTPVGVGQGVCALYTDELTELAARSAAEALMRPLGLAEWIADEAQFNLVTALSGCGPAYLFRFIDALGIAAARLGLPEDQAARLALATVRGASTLAVEAGESPGILADRVASPGGMTREGMNVLDAGESLIALLTETLRAARDRGEEMARKA
ncbi:pyrroline-5-carboxylate reductase [Sphingobium phenoxybenzoativorans]|uniref:Pyrroline-5-carboxylate reductase n=1 Tax=Sphingobium phenoxybenzoativorans TaxID=1592790 RepID=A0A975K5C0_9SPHN|nr:pyrroline-5-carboxylate reductase [Sphingobium phenoxybenzoativorans]QUT04654.1 pyrroline-5-carboxylate reductase [Sphingobium phenoxybenzoativorans]